MLAVADVMIAAWSVIKLMITARSTIVNKRQCKAHGLTNTAPLPFVRAAVKLPVVCITHKLYCVAHSRMTILPLLRYLTCDIVMFITDVVCMVCIIIEGR